MNNFSKLVAGGTTSALLLLSTATSALAEYNTDYSTTYGTGSDTAGLVASSMSCLISLLCTIPIVIIWGGVAYWVHKDAKSRGNENALLWAILTFVLGLLGLIIYLLTQRDKPVLQNTQTEESNTDTTPN